MGRIPGRDVDCVGGKRRNGLGEVSADAEGALTRAGQDDRPNLVVGIHFMECTTEIVVHRQGQRIQFFRPVDANRRDVAIPDEIDRHQTAPDALSRASSAASHVRKSGEDLGIVLARRRRFFK